MKYTSKPQITIDGNQVCFRSPVEENIIRLIGNVGDPIVAYPPNLQKGGKITLPNGERIRVPYFGGKITKVSPCAYTCDVVYEFEVYIDMDDGTKMVHRDRYHHNIPNLWRLYSRKKLKIHSISDYHAYEKYEEERDAAYKEFQQFWSAKDPLRKDELIE